MPELNEPQQRAVAHAEGPLLVFAGAGSGKTRVITYRVANLLAQHYVPPYRILAVTFTNKAAGEMRARLEQLAGEEVTGDLWIGTFHSVCARLLRRYHAEVGLDRDYVIYDASDQKAVMARLLKDRGLSERVYPPKQVLSRINRQKREGIGPREVSIGRSFDDEMRDLYEAYQVSLLRSNAVDFEDLILHVLRIAESDTEAGGELRERFRHVLVDEFQDTNAIQYRLVVALSAKERNLCVVGDDDQSIYSWRGANVANILGFQRDFPEATVVKLEQNYRSTKNVIAAALGIIQRAGEREPKNLWADASDGEPVRVHGARDEREEAAFVVQTIRSETARGTAPGAIAVFYRIHAQSRVIEEALREAGIHYQIIGGMKFFERAEVKDLLAYLRLIDNPRSDADLLRIINVPARGIGNKTVDRVLSTARQRDTSLYDAIEPTIAGVEIKKAAKTRLGAFKALIERLRAVAKETVPHELAERVLAETGYVEPLREDDTAESDARLENLAELVGSIREYHASCEKAGTEPSLGGYLERISLISDVDSMEDAESVTLMTVHSAKGLEFDTVLLTGMEEEMFPYRGIDGDSLEELDEERRLAYVAVTRTRHRLYVTHAASRMIFGQTRYQAPSRFLADLPEEVCVRTGSASVAYRSRRPAWTTAASFYEPPKEPEPAELQPGERVIDYDVFDDIPPFQPGDRVFHRRFGSGIVRSVQAGGDANVVAHFPGWGERKVRASFLSVE